MTAESLEKFRQNHQRIVERLYRESGADKWNLSQDSFARVLYRSYARRAESGPAFATPKEIDAFLESLFVRDLALAAACRQGNDDAWNQFLAAFKAVIESAARAAISDPSAARELADSLYAELYGLRSRDGLRDSPLDRYHGRSALTPWLRTVIARRAADWWRARRVSEPIDWVTERAMKHTSLEAQDPKRARYLAMLCDSLRRALAELPPADRLRLSFYYLQELTLAQIGALTAEHESTVSRKLAHTRSKLRADVEEALRLEHHLSADEISLCFEYATEDWPFNLAEVLSQAK